MILGEEPGFVQPIVPCQLDEERSPVFRFMDLPGDSCRRQWVWHAHQLPWPQPAAPQARNPCDQLLQRWISKPFHECGPVDGVVRAPNAMSDTEATLPLVFNPVVVARWQGRGLKQVIWRRWRDAKVGIGNGPSDVYWQIEKPAAD